ncbi:hypothetical protein Hanom_Chr05g00403811 [Helianthus anomalus]
MVRYIHCCIATYITRRGMRNEWCTSSCLFYLYYLFTGRLCVLNRCLAEYFTSYYYRQRHHNYYTRTIMGMWILLKFDGIEYWFVGQDDMIFVPQLLVHKPPL